MLQRPAAAPFSTPQPSTPEQLGRRARRAWLLFAAIALAIATAALYGAGLYGRTTEVGALAAQG
ncbi:two-component sensor histidine kinase, partial [Mesorhizobium sp. M5C.F.Ca.IN.020.14.1.1]